MEKELLRLLEAVRAISPEASVEFLQGSDPHEWSIKVAVRDVILVSTEAGTLSMVTHEAAKKIEGMSQRILLAVRPTDPPPSK